MTLYEIENKLDALYQELKATTEMDEQTACKVHNADSKIEAISLINEDINSYEYAKEELESYKNRVRNYYRTADSPYLCW